MSDLASSSAVATVMDGVNEEKFRNLEINRVGGMPVSIYVFFDTFLKCIYFAIKIILFTNTFDNNADNAFDDVNHEFNKGFDDFINGRTIILAYLLFHTISSTYQTTKYYGSQRGSMPGVLNCFMVICILLLWIDFIVSVVLICVRCMFHFCLVL